MNKALPQSTFFRFVLGWQIFETGKVSSQNIKSSSPSTAAQATGSIVMHHLSPVGSSQGISGQPLLFKQFPSPSDDSLQCKAQLQGSSQKQKQKT